jgi:FKBP-type peptidyl-prolyl cis-trans isomerase
MAGVDHALMDMNVCGHRKVRISLYLAYRDTGSSDLIPPDAVLICEIWLRDIVSAHPL